MEARLTQSEAAKEILTQLARLSFDEIMALPVSAEAVDINNALSEMGNFLSDLEERESSSDDQPITDYSLRKIRPH